MEKITPTQDVMSQWSDEKKQIMRELWDLGFRNPELMEFKKIDEHYVKMTLIDEKTKFYEQIYPENKFISEEKVNDFVTRGDTQLGSISNIMTFIPDRNKIDLVKFRVIRRDVRMPYRIYPNATMSYLEGADRYDDSLPGQFLVVLIDPNSITILQPVHYGFLIVTQWKKQTEN
ncbi:MAG: hypothetical protein J5I47_09340 [Vicingus serpentipes]|nr:hypothetical protein [Vicingus serpentipes]